MTVAMELGRGAQTNTFCATISECESVCRIGRNSFSAAEAVAPNWGRSVEEFLDDSPLSSGSRRVYAATLRAFGDCLQVCSHLCCLTPERFGEAFIRVSDGGQPATVNRARSTLRTFLRWCESRNLPLDAQTLAAALPPRRPDYRPRLEPDPNILAHCFDSALPLRDRTLWCLVFDTSLRAADLLALDVDNFDLSRHLIRVGASTVEWQRFSTGLIEQLLATRLTGPAFAVSHGPIGLPDYTRLSYRRAAEACRYYTGRCLKDFRAAGITHLARVGVPEPLLRTRKQLLSQVRTGGNGR